MIPGSEGHIRQPGEVFVYGTALDGGRTILTVACAKLFAADPTVVEGRTGEAYALPVWMKPGIPLSRIAIAEYAERFVAHALAHPMTTFFLPALSAGVYTAAEMGLCFAKVPTNVRVPPEWVGYLERVPLPEVARC